MKKMKKIVALLLAMAMVMGMSLTAFAEKTGGKIVVNGLSTASEQTVKIYEIYRLDSNDNLWEKAAWVGDTLATPDDLSKTDKIAELAAKVTDADCIATQISSTGTVTFEESGTVKLQAGAYLVIASDKNNSTVYNPMVAVTYDYDAAGLIQAATATVTAKADSYTITKEQKDEDAVVAVGDTIPYEIKTTIPYVADNTAEASLVIRDTLTGAIYDVNKADFKLTVGGEEVEITPTVNEDRKGFTLDLSNLVDVENKNAGKEVVITYKAVVTEVDDITNTASSNRVTDEDGNMVPTTPTKNYTGQITITKYAAAAEEGQEPTQTLQGAEFALYRLVDGKKEYAEIDSNGCITGQWYAEAEEGVVPTGAGKVVTDKDGVCTVKGLDVGTYYFKETVAPDGYSINANDVSAELKLDEGKTEATATISATTSMTDTKLTSLPSTGGIGTTIFTIGGCLIMIVAAGLFFATRRKSAK